MSTATLCITTSFFSLLYVAGSFDTSKATPNTPNAIGTEKPPIDTPIKVPTDVIQYESLKKVPSIRNDYSIDCSYYQIFENFERFVDARAFAYTLPNNYFIADYRKYVEDATKTKEIPENIVCLMLDANGKINNNFPVFNFDRIIQELFQTSASDFKILGAGSTKRLVLKPSATDKYKEAQENAKKITKYLLDSISFSNEIALLDIVRFSSNASTESDTNGLYSTYNYFPHEISVASTPLEKAGSKQLVNNRRTISIKVKDTLPFASISGQESPALATRNKPVGSFYEDPNYLGVSFDLHSLGQTFAHEYGHHKTLFNSKISDSSEATKFINKLKEFFPQGNSERRKDFEVIFNHANGLSTNQTDAGILSIFRKYFSKNIVTLKDILKDPYPATPTAEWIQKTKKNIAFFGYQGTGIKTSTEVYNSFVNPISNGRSVLEYTTSDTSHQNPSINKNAYNTLRDNVIDGSLHNYAFYKLNLLEIVDTNTKGVNQYFPVSNNYNSATPNTNSVVTIGDVFPNMNVEDVLPPNDLNSSQPTSCSDLPFFPISGGLTPYDKTIIENTLPNKFTKKQYLSSSSSADKTMVDFIKYIFSYKELTGRLGGVLGYKYGDDRAKTIKTCSLEYSNTPTIVSVITNSKKLSVENLLDYGWFRSFDMNVLETEQKTNDIHEYFYKKEADLKTNQIKFRQGTYFNSGDTTEKTTRLFYSHNVIGKTPNDEYENNQDLQNNNEIRGLNSIYMLARVKLDSPTDVSKLKIEFTNNYVRSATNYDYNHKTTIISEDSNYNDSLLLKNKDADVNKLFDIVFSVVDIKYLFHVEEKNDGTATLRTRFENDSGSYVRTRDKLETNYSTLRRAFIDVNGNDKFDDGEQEIEII